MSGGRGTSEHTCAACGRTVTLTRRPDYGAGYVCMDCRSKPSDVAKTIVEQRKRHGAALQRRLYDAAVEDQEQP